MNPRLLPLAVLAVFLTLLGTLIYLRVQETRQEPFFDILTYAAKGKAFWDAVGEGKRFNPLDLEPTTRPPGTVLVTYPFGFSRDFHGFYFRTVFFPIVIFAFALWVAGKKARERPGGPWLVLVLVVAFSSLPLFYQFEAAPSSETYPWPTCWGLVDTTLGALAALAAALVARGAPARSVGLTAAGIAVAAFCLFIKPSGLLVMGALFVVWVFFALSGRKQGNVRRYVLSCLAVFFVLYGAALSAAWLSRYFSPANMAYGEKAVDILVSEWPLARWWPVLWRQIHFTLGFHWLFFVAAIAFLAGLSRPAHEQQKEGESFAGPWLPSALAVLGIGLWFWLVATGKSQVRYFYPFLLMVLVLAFPPILEALERIGGPRKRVFAGLSLLPALLLLVFLLPEKPLGATGPVLGVHLDSGGLNNVVAQAKVLVGEARKKGKDSVVYIPSEDYGNAVFTGVGGYSRLVEPDKPSFLSRLAIRWDRIPAIVLSDMASADFILFEPVTPPAMARRILEKKDVPDFASEKLLIRSWLTGLDSLSSGLALHSESALRLLQVTDRQRFTALLGGLRERHEWREAFEEANFRGLVNGDEVNRRLSEGKAVVRGVRFGDRFFLEGLEMRRDGEGLTLDLYWRSLEEATLDGVVFIHLVDAGGTILGQWDYGQDPGMGTARKGVYWRDRVRIPGKRLEGATAVALGVYRPPDFFFPPDQGTRDWGGRRLIVPLGE